MHERRNTVLILLLIAAITWAFVVWLAGPVFGWDPPAFWAQRITSLAAIAALGGMAFWALKIEDKLDDELAKVNFGHYFEQDGLCFVPLVRVTEDSGQFRAEVSIYYQNRFSNPCEAVIHLRPKERAFHSHPGKRDVHFAFSCPPGAFGVIHQPVAVVPEFQGMPVDVELAAAVRWPRGHGDQLRSRTGAPCGTFNVDWALAYRQTDHELSGEIELKDPATVHLVMPENAADRIRRSDYTQEILAQGAA
jgi:hypothetical protein